VSHDQGGGGDVANDEEQGHDAAPRSGLYASAAAATQRQRDRERRRKLLVTGLAGAAVVVAGAGFLAGRMMSPAQTVLPEPAALAPMTLATSATTPEVESDQPFVTRTPQGFRPAKPVERSPAATPKRAGSPAPGGPRVSAAAGGLVEQGARGGISEWTEALENGTVRIVTARRDLAGERELRLAGDPGQLVGGGVRCTSDVRLATGVPEERRPAVLLCWRTSAARSVITMAVVSRGEPPTAASVAIVGREWARLG
jgi:hypothetical protein